ncbi:hypothetical protein L208DRAFT_1388285, partial [Tricholoma matsutake]
MLQRLSRNELRSMKAQARDTKPWMNSALTYLAYTETRYTHNVDFDIQGGTEHNHMVRLLVLAPPPAQTTETVEDPVL